MTTFIALDVETANPDLASICQIGLVVFRDGEIISTWETLVDPEDYFDPMNVWVHGITETDVQDAPTYAQLAGQLNELLNGNVVVTHTPFDRGALRGAAERYAVPAPVCTWLDSARVARRAWSEYSSSGYGLANLAADFGIDYQAHRAVEDARCAGVVLLRAIADTGMSVDQWIVRVSKPITEHNIAQAGNPDGPLHGHVIVFTGALSIVRSEAAALAARAGCDVEAGVTKRTTLVIVGDQDVQKLHGHEKSSKHQKAEQLIGKGQPLRILRETDFFRLIGS